MADLKELETVLREIQARLTEVRRRMISDYYTGTSFGSPHWQVCGVCSWVWPFGDPENHEVSCPIAFEGAIKEESDDQ